jgi:glycolate oxidase FAD binding subunit
MQVNPGAPVVEPDTPEGLARALAEASASGRRVTVRGGGTKLGWGNDPPPASLVIDTRRLSRVLAYAEGDLTVTCEAGVTLDALNRELSKRRQWLPLDSAFDEATIGGILATNDAGPLRHRYGTPRDLLIGVRVATTDGRLVKAGGRVVKNVAGYDIGRLVAGSFGSLAVIVEATFKLTPLPAAFGTQRFTFTDRAAAAEAVAMLSSMQIDPVALDVRFHAAVSERPIEVLVRFGSTPAAVEAQMAEAERRLAASAPRTAHRVVGIADEGVWRVHGRRIWSGGGMIARVSWLPASFGAVFSLLADMRRRVSVVELVARAGIGAGLLRIDAEDRAQVAVVRELRERFDVFNQVSVLRAQPPVKAAVDVWGPAASTAPLLAAIKRALDPAGVLNVGRGPV